MSNIDTESPSTSSIDKQEACGTKGTAQESSTKLERPGKIFSDPIHGQILLPPACIAVIDTPEFQRLRDLKQLGMAYYVFPGAAHNRFEHCLGVCHLAGQFAEYLMNSQMQLGITKQDILCLQLAGLIHDLGHGPFSHLFDKSVAPKLLGHKWKHEDASKEIFQHIYDKNKKVQDTFTDYGLDQNDVDFIKNLIDPTNIADTQNWPKRWNGVDKTFLFEIVSNDRNKMDVDKWDYIARDCHLLGIRNSFDHSRFMKFARVIEVTEGEHKKKHICLRDKELLNVYSMFTSRYLLHKMAYQHKVVCGLDIMVTQALLKAKDDLRFKGCTILEIIKDKKWEAYTILTDNILYKIRDYDGDNDNLKAAQKIVEQIFKRDFYRCVYESNPFTKTVDEKALTEATIKAEIMEDSTSAKLDLFVQIVYYDLGMNAENPLDKMFVYSKQNPNKARKIGTAEMSQILIHTTCVERKVRIYVSNANKEDAITKACLKWDKKHLPSKLWKDDNVDPPSPSENA